SSNRVKLRFGNNFAHLQVLFIGGASHEDIVLILCQGFDDSGNLFGRFPCTEYGLWKSLPQGPVMVHIGESQILERKIAEPVQRLAFRKHSSSVIIKNFSNLILGHGRPTLYPMCWSH